MSDQTSNSYILAHWATWLCPHCYWTVPAWAREELLCVALIKQHIREHDDDAKARRSL